MINTSVNKNEHTIQSGVVDYPIGFPFYFNPDRTPQLLVKIGDEKLRFNHNFKLSEDKGSVVLMPTEEESWTLESPEDFSWMAKWDGKDLLIERVVPFVQDSDYQLGRISAEQIERDFDLSVMRDQTLDDKIDETRDEFAEANKDLSDKIDETKAELQEAIDDKLPLTGGTLTGPLTISADKSAGATLTLKNESGKSYVFSVSETGIRMPFRIYSTQDIKPSGVGEFDLGDWLNKWKTVYTTGLSNAIGEFIAVPEKSGTLARIEDLTDLRADIGEADSELQTQIAAQAAKIATKQDKLTAGDNIIISNNVISATGAGGGAGLSIVVVQELPATGQKGIIYLLAKDGAAPDVYDEYVWIASTQMFELIGSTQVDLTDYAKKEYVDNAIAEFESFPDQTGNAGKFLQTDGTTASWGDALVNKNSGNADSIVIKPQDVTNYGTSVVAIGSNASARKQSVHIGCSSFDNLSGGRSVGVGYGTTTNNYSVAIGASAKTTADYAIQLGYNATNSDANTFKVANQNGNFEMMSADGTIPADRMSATAGTAGQVLTKTDTGMKWQKASAGGTKITIIRYDE